MHIGPEKSSPCRPLLGFTKNYIVEVNSSGIPRSFLLWSVPMVTAHVTALSEVSFIPQYFGGRLFECKPEDCEFDSYRVHDIRPSLRGHLAENYKRLYEEY